MPTCNKNLLHIGDLRRLARIGFEQLGEVKYMYRFSGARIDKQVSFFLFRAVGGEIDALQPEMRKEVEVARWVSLSDAPRTLSYPGEQEMARRALEVLSRP